MSRLPGISFIFGSVFSILLCTATSESDSASKEELALIADMLANPKDALDLRDETVALENSLDSKELDLKEYIKRDSNFEPMEYGWGGGRWGKRDADTEYGWGGGRWGKRYDPFSVGGRFGKRASLIDETSDKRYDPFSVGGRFGKRYDPYSVGGRFGKRYDPYSVGGRFGKRYDPYSVGGRFGKRGSSEDEKRYDPFSVGGRFGKRDQDNGFKRYDQYSVGGRFGRDVSNVKAKTKQ